jgi:Predicted membrane protein
MFGLVLALPFVLANAFLTALTKLGLGPLSALGVAVGIFVGGAINIPVARIEQTEILEYRPTQLLRLGHLLSRPVRRQFYTTLAVNLGGCLVPTALAGYQIGRLVLQAPEALLVLGAALILDVGLCYYFAAPMSGKGIALQPLIPAGAAALSGLVLAPAWTPPIAFSTGVLGPLIGADLLHLDDIVEIGTGMASIGGAGTFDGVVLSGLVATLLVPGAL